MTVKGSKSQREAGESGCRDGGRVSRLSERMKNKCRTVLKWGVTPLLLIIAQTVQKLQSPETAAVGDWDVSLRQLFFFAL